jgi:hypothetical protein
VPEELTLAARNPYALAEIVQGHPIDWSKVDDRPALLERVLQTPYEQLFDPKYDSPVYLGFQREGQRMRRVDPVYHAAETPADDAKRFPDTNGHIRRLGDLSPLLLDGPLQDVPVRSVIPSRAGGYTIEIGEPPLKRQESLARIFSPSVLEALLDINKILSGWTPAGGEWKDTGTFFKESAEFFDPIQSGLADCWLIAAMSSVAWAAPYTFAQRSRATGTGNEQFNNLLSFTDPATHTKKDFEVTDAIVVFQGTSSPMYARSSEDGEMWPGLIEKAFAQWRSNTTNDRPNMTVVEYGDCVWASAAITGGNPQYTGTASSTAAQLDTFVKSHSVSHRTIRPVTAWTYGSADDAPDEIDYSDANIVANHCYSVLGWVSGSALLDMIDVKLKVTDAMFANSVTAGGSPDHFADIGIRTKISDAAWTHILNRDYIVLRNPWGYHEGTRGNLAGTIQLKDVSFWRSINLGDTDGVFAIDFPTFKKYYAGIGVAA